MAPQLFETVMAKGRSAPSLAPRNRLRSWLVRVHLILALTVGVAVSVLGLTGTVLLFRQAIYSAQNAALLRVAPHGSRLPLEEQARSALARNRGAEIAFVRMPQRPNETTQFFVQYGERDARNRSVFVNPYTGRVLGSNPQSVSWLDWIGNLHKNFFLGRLGRRAHGYVACLFLVILATGILLWWPAKTLTPKPNLRGWRRALDLHRVAGIWTVVLLSIFPVTALSLSWDLSKLVSTSAKDALPHSDWKRGQPIAPLDMYLRNAQAALPQGTPVFLSLPSERSTLVSIGLCLPEDFRREGALNTIDLDPGSGAALRVDRFQDHSFGQRLLADLAALHFGEFGVFTDNDLPTRLLWSVLGLVPPFLFTTGLITWWRRPST